MICANCGQRVRGKWDHMEYVMVDGKAVDEWYQRPTYKCEASMVKGGPRRDDGRKDGGGKR